MKEILAKLRDGRNVALFPEGNRSFNGLSGDFPPATGKLVKKSGATLVTYRLHGGYLTTPRWSTSLRKGKLWGEIAGIYSPEKLKAMTEDEVNRAIRHDLFVDAYADQKKTPSLTGAGIWPSGWSLHFFPVLSAAPFRLCTAKETPFVVLPAVMKPFTMFTGFCRKVPARYQPSHSWTCCSRIKSGSFFHPPKPLNCFMTRLPSRRSAPIIKQFHPKKQNLVPTPTD